MIIFTDVETENLEFESSKNESRGPVYHSIFLMINEHRLRHAAWQCVGPASTGDSYSQVYKLASSLVACCSTRFAFFERMLSVTTRNLLLFYLFVDVIINLINLASGKLTRCSGIWLRNLCCMYFENNSCWGLFYRYLLHPSWTDCNFMQVAT